MLTREYVDRLEKTFYTADMKWPGVHLPHRPVNQVFLLDTATLNLDCVEQAFKPFHICAGMVMVVKMRGMNRACGEVVRFVRVFTVVVDANEIHHSVPDAYLLLDQHSGLIVGVWERPVGFQENDSCRFTTTDFVREILESLETYDHESNNDMEVAEYDYEWEQVLIYCPA